MKRTKPWRSLFLSLLLLAALTALTACGQNPAPPEENAPVKAGQSAAVYLGQGGQPRMIFPTWPYEMGRGFFRDAPPGRPPTS